MDEPALHRHFAAKCFNDTWALLDKPDRTAADDRLMRETAHASLYHWLRRDDCGPTNLSVGLWLLSRVYASLGRAAAAAKIAEECLALSEAESLPPFYQGYAHEAAARAAQLAGDPTSAERSLAAARAQLEQVADEEEAKLLRADLEALATSC